MREDAPLALRYRPKKFSDLVGQDAATRILVNSIKQSNLHHAYIFSGKFGCGKTSAARIFAASLNSPGGITLEPDTSDPVVQSIFDGKAIDVKEIDAASSRGIDDIRALKEEISLAPVECKYKFVIIDEAHQLTGAAAEAALKMIEEPPRNVIFVLCTTEANKLKETIHTRCMPLRFNQIHWTLISQHIAKVAKQEGFQIDDMAIKIAAKKAQGSMRNALQNLQMMSTFAGKGNPITVEVATNALSALDENYYFDLVDAILKPDASEAMRVIDRLLEGGRDVGEVLSGLVAHLRNLLVAGTCRSTSGLLVLTDDEKQKYNDQIGNIRQTYGAVQIQFVVSLIELIGTATRDIALNINPQVVLEAFCVKAIIESARCKKQAQSMASSA